MKSWFAKLQGYIAKRRVERAAQEFVDTAIGTTDVVLNKFPPLLGSLTQVLINNKTEIEAAIKTGIKVKNEMHVILEEFAKEMQSTDEQVDAVWAALTRKLKQIFAETSEQATQAK